MVAVVVEEAHEVAAHPDVEDSRPEVEDQLTGEEDSVVAVEAMHRTRIRLAMTTTPISFPKGSIFFLDYGQTGCTFKRDQVART